MSFEEFKNNILQNEWCTSRNECVPEFKSYMHARTFLLMYNYYEYFRDKEFLSQKDFTYYRRIIKKEGLWEEWNRFLDCVLYQLFEKYKQNLG